MKKVKICFASSSGGHLEQILMLEPLMEKYDGFIVTERTVYASETGRRTYYLRQINRREPLMMVKMVANSFRSLYIIIKERPTIVITTGALAVIPICLLEKLLGGKLIFIESFAKITSPNDTGRLMYRFADRFYVQWPRMKEFYPDALYVGGIY